MTTVLYRLSSGEVLKISPQNNPFSARNTAYFGVLTDPAFPDGAVLRDTLPDGSLGPLRVFGFAKHWDGVNCRNATLLEINGYAALETADDNAQDATRAADLGDTDLIFRKLVKAIIKGVIRENNIQADRYNELRAEMLAATSLSNLQTRILANTSNMPTRTNQQGFDAIRSDVEAND